MKSASLARGRLSEHRVVVGGMVGDNLKDIPVLDDLAPRHAEDVGLDEAPGLVVHCPDKILIGQ